MRTQHKPLSRKLLLEDSRCVRITTTDYARMQLDYIRESGGAIASSDFYAKPFDNGILGFGWLTWLMPEVTPGDDEVFNDEVQPVWLTTGEVAYRLAGAISRDDVWAWDAEGVPA